MNNSKRTEYLVRHLHDGYVLCKEHNNDPECREFLFSYGIGKYEIRGWGTAFGEPKDRILELVTDPDCWKVIDFNQLKQDYPFPWSSLKTVNYKFKKDEKE